MTRLELDDVVAVARIRRGEYLSEDVRTLLRVVDGLAGALERTAAWTWSVAQAGADHLTVADLTTARHMAAQIRATVAIVQRTK